MRCHYGITGRHATLARHAFRHAERIAKAARLAQRAYTQKQRALRPCRREKDPLAAGLAMRDTAGGGHVKERWVMGRSYEGRLETKARGLLDRIKRGGAALFEIAEGEDSRAKLRECPVIGQCKTAHFLGCFFFAIGFDFAPVVLGIPLAVGPMLHLVGSLCLHRVPPMFRARAGTNRFWRQSGITRQLL